jgi:hypothetical protein
MTAPFPTGPTPTAPAPEPVSPPAPEDHARLDPADLLTRAEASAWLEQRGIRMKPNTLARAYSTGSGGPPCRHIRNKPYYPRDLLEVWARAQITAPAASSSERQRLRREARQEEKRLGRHRPQP